jgi:hypothetical protein
MCNIVECIAPATCMHTLRGHMPHTHTHVTPTAAAMAATCYTEWITSHTQGSSHGGNMLHRVDHITHPGQQPWRPESSRHRQR